MSIQTISPSTGATIFTHPGHSAAETTALIDTAAAAFKTYKKTTLAQRTQWVVAALDIIKGLKETLVGELTAQMGRPIASAGGEIDTMRKRADYMMSIAEQALADLPGQAEEGFKRWTSLEPVGPVLIVSAWNVSTCTGWLFDVVG